MIPSKKTWKSLLFGAIVLLAGVIVVFQTFFPTLLYGKTCARDDPEVLSSARVLQEFFSIDGRFPDQNALASKEELNDSFDAAILEGVRGLYDADFFSNAGTDDLFVYFKSNCKLRIRPATFEVFPRR